MTVNGREHFGFLRFLEKKITKEMGRGHGVLSMGVSIYPELIVLFTCAVNVSTSARAPHLVSP